MDIKIKLLLTSLFLGLLFVLFSYLVAREYLVKTDFDVTVRLQDNIPRKFDDEFSIFSDVGKFEVSIIILVLILVFGRKIIFGVVAFGLFGLFHVIELFGKFFVDQHPPPQFMLRTQHIIDFPQFHVRSEFSYPSGHAGRATFLSLLFIFFIYKSKKLKKWQKIILIASLIAYDILMYVSRPYLGEHWLSDVVGGALLAGSFALFSISIYSFSLKNIFNHKSN